MSIAIDGWQGRQSVQLPRVILDAGPSRHAVLLLDYACASRCGSAAADRGAAGVSECGVA